MEIRAYKHGASRCFVPKSCGNSKDKSPVRVWIDSPSEWEKHDLEGDTNPVRWAVNDKGEAIKDAAGNLMMEVDSRETKRLHRAAIERFVSRVENFRVVEISPDGGESSVDVTTGAGFVAHASVVMQTEVFREIMSALSLTDDEEKKSKGSPGSSLVATQASSGTAANASETVTAQHGTAQVAKVDSGIR